MTLNAIVKKILKPLAEDHLQINDFGFGDLHNYSTIKSQKYPLMWVVLKPLRYSNKAFNYNFSIVFADIAKDDLSNALEIQSDMIQIAADIAGRLAYINDPDIDINTDFTLTPFSERFVDVCSGVVLDLTISSAKVLSDCEFPSIVGLSAAKILTEDGAYILTEDGYTIIPE